MLRHFHFLHFVPNKELKELYINLAIRTFGFSLIAIFIPIYLLQLGYDVTAVIAFYIVNFAMIAISCWIGAGLMSRVGTKHTIAFSIPFLIAFYVLLLTIQTQSIPILLLAVLHGFQEGLYWIAYHTDFAVSTKKYGRGEAVGVAHSLFRLVSVVGPIAGAFVISLISFSALFVTASAVFIASATPLFLTRDRRTHKIPSLSKVFSNRGSVETIANFGVGMKHTGNLFLWPLAIFLILGDVLSVGEIVSGMMLFMVILNLTIGRLSDKHNSTVIMRLGGILDAATWAVRAGVTSFFSVFGISAIGGMTSAMAGIPFEKKTYDRSKRRGVVEYLLYRETVFGVGRVFLLMFIILVLSSNVQLGLILVGLGSLGHLLF